DICCADRFEAQVRFLESRPDIDCLGGWISEFAHTPDKPWSFREVPVDHRAISRAMGKYCAMNHMTVMYRREAVLRAGNYPSFRGFEDYPLWAAMLVQGCRMANLDRVLVHVRAGQSLIARRGGFRYALNELRG